MTLSLRAKLVLIACAILFLAMAANTSVNGLVFAREYSHAVLSWAFVIDDELASQLDRLLNLNIPIDQLIGFEEQCKEVLARHDFLSYAMVVTPRGEILFHSDPIRHGQVIDDPEVLNHVRLPRPTSHASSGSDGRFYDVFKPILYRGEHVGTVRIGFPVEFVRTKINRMIAYSIAVTLVFLGLGIGAMVVSLNVWVSKPLGRFIRAGETVTGKGATVKQLAEGTPTDEIGRLSATFNSMLSDLQWPQLSSATPMPAYRSVRA